MSDQKSGFIKWTFKQTLEFYKSVHQKVTKGILTTSINTQLTKNSNGNKFEVEEK